jgi:hypothetical protein
MEEYLDAEGKKLEKGFYKNKVDDDIIYFTGEYNKNRDPVFEINDYLLSNFHLPLQGGSGVLLNKINKKEVEEIINRSKNKINWLEEKLKE